MTDKNSPDRFSAFHDGELLGAEGEMLRGELASSDEARREVDEYQQLSRLLNELPTERLGEEFPAAVLQAVERSMLLPVADELAVAPRGRQSRGRWLSAIAAFTASAAALFVAVKLLEKHDQNEAVSVFEGRPAQPKSGPERNLDVGIADVLRDTAKAPEGAPLLAGAKEDGSSESETVAKSEKPAAPARHFGGGFGGGGLDRREDDAQPSDSKADDFDGNAKDAPAESVDEPAITNLDGPSTPLEFNKKLNDVEVGEVVEALVRSDDKISVVRLTVVDRIAGLQQLQVLLTNNSFAMAGEPIVLNSPAKKAGNSEIAETRAKGAQSAEEDAADKSKVKELAPEASGDEVYCVLVNTDTMQLANALTQLELGREFKDLRLEDPPLAVAELDEESSSAVDFSSNGQVSSRVEGRIQNFLKVPPQSVDKGGDLADQNSGKKQEKRLIEKSPSIASNSEKQTADETMQSTPVVQSQQLSMKIPSRLLAKADLRQQVRRQLFNQSSPRMRAMKQAERQPQAASEAKSQSPPAPTAQSAQSKNELQQGPARPVRVLLVLEDRHQKADISGPASPAAAPASKSP